jgi:hypothetical protein
VEHDASRREGLPPFGARELDRPGRPSADVKAKLQQQISGCWRTLAGAEAFLALRSFVSTVRKQGMNPLPCCASLLRAAPGHQPP